MTAIIECAGGSDIGHSRQRNEDHFLIAHLAKALEVRSTNLTPAEQEFHADVAGELFVVADGMGGRAAGEKASRLAVQAVAEYVLNLLPWFFRLRRDAEYDLIE